MKQVFNDGELSATQYLAIELLIQKHLTKMSFREVSEKLGVNERSLLRWRGSPIFREALRVRSIEALGDSTHEVLATLTRKAIAGDNKAIQMYLQVTGLLHEGAVAPKVEEPDPKSNDAILKEIEDLEKQILEIERDDYKENRKKAS